MSKFLTQRTLLLIAGFLIALKFGVTPLLIWQGDKLAQLARKSVQLEKASEIVAGYKTYQSSLMALNVSLENLDQYFYPDQAGTQLLIQREVEELFSLNRLNITGFDWIIDASAPIRLLRAKIFFSGETKNMMSAFWQLSTQTKFVKLVEWNQQIRPSFGTINGDTRGYVTLEFYAWGYPFKQDEKVDSVDGQA